VQPVPRPSLALAAALRRLEVRHGPAGALLPPREGVIVVLSYHPDLHAPMVAEAVALYLYVYCGLGIQEAAKVRSSSSSVAQG
jgi:hypothetical protein